MLSSIGRFLQEVRRRKVGRVIAIYAAVSWILAEGSSVVFPALRLPEWSVTLVVSLLIIGFPIAVVLAWAFDLTPEGVRRTPHEDARSGTTEAGPVPAESTSVATDGRPVRSREDAIAVIPFANLAEAADQDAFVDGLTDELISQLAHVRGIRVSARTSAFALRDKGLDAREIGERLQVARLVEGSVRITDRRMKLTAHLVDVASGAAEWSEVYTMELEDIFEVQAAVARSIVDRLRPETGAALEDAQTRRSTHDVEAYSAYARGRYQWNLRTEEGLRKAVDHFERAIDDDPGYALAHAGLADAYSILLEYGLMKPSEARRRAMDAAETAVSLAPEAGECQTSLGVIRQLSWQWRGAARSFQIGLRQAPSYAVTHQRYALHLAWLGRNEESLVRIDDARRLDPLSPAVKASVGWIHYYGRRYDEASKALERALESEPELSSALSSLGLTLSLLGRHGEAIRAHEKALRHTRRSTASKALLGYVYGRAGESEAASRIAGGLRDAGHERYVSGYYMALPHLGMGDKETALRYLAEAVEERSPHLVYAKVDPILDPLRAEPRFQRILTEVGFHERDPAG